MRPGELFHDGVISFWIESRTDRDRVYKRR
jgi:hypothetical protein